MQAMVASPTTNDFGFLTLVQHTICIKKLVLSQMFNYIKEMKKWLLVMVRNFSSCMLVLSPLNPLSCSSNYRKFFMFLMWLQNYLAFLNSTLAITRSLNFIIISFLLRIKIWGRLFFKEKLRMAYSSLYQPIKLVHP